MNAFKFMKETSMPDKHGEIRAKILSLVKDIESLYKQHMRKSTGKTCDICGAGDDNEIYRVKDVVMGYEHREHLSPCLCHRHFCGWNASYVRCGFLKEKVINDLDLKGFEMIAMCQMTEQMLRRDLEIWLKARTSR